VKSKAAPSKVSQRSPHECVIHWISEQDPHVLLPPFNRGAHRLDGHRIPKRLVARLQMVGAHGCAEIPNNTKLSRNLLTLNILLAKMKEIVGQCRARLAQAIEFQCAVYLSSLWPRRLSNLLYLKNCWFANMPVVEMK